MAEYKGRRERKRAAGGKVGEAAKPSHHMLIVIGLAPKKPKKSGGKVEGAAAKHHLGKMARGGASKPSPAIEDWTGADDGRTGQSTNMGTRPYSADGDSDEERILGVSERRKEKAKGGRLEGGPVPYARGGYDTRAEGGKAGHWIQGAREKMEKKGTVGSLHAALHVPQGDKIPEKKLSAAKAKAERTGNTKLMRKVTFAENVRH